ncbi:MAG: biotin--[acetyl-CoA-carboxylase] ligase [Fimbriimonadaceae bacterium]|nr:biotin--[acetyl-CoA-carboxylase] ligase [Fimbriimonadaceae bacterium]QYK57136.1 MAG: biotin--[acetyl-CoA-carboxylase] ligase [Fimbriimonadaceae bacterium]
MKIGPNWLLLDAVDSTQRVLQDLQGLGVPCDVVYAKEQLAGRGRFDRTWYSQKGSSLTFSVAIGVEESHNQPWLFGMAAAVATASVINCKVQWPNDLLLRNKKVGGILSSMVSKSTGQRAVLAGIGINLGEGSYPETLAESATSLSIAQWEGSAIDLAEAIVAKCRDVATPRNWSELLPLWQLFDATPGKEYREASGRVVTAIGVGPNGELLGSADGETVSVMAAEALWGS